MNHWQWHETSGIPYLTCDLLAQWKHGFFTRSSWPAKPETIAPLVAFFNPKAIEDSENWIRREEILKTAQMIYEQR